MRKKELIQTGIQWLDEELENPPIPFLNEVRVLVDKLRKEVDCGLC